MFFGQIKLFKSVVVLQLEVLNLNYLLASHYELLKNTFNVVPMLEHAVVHGR